MLELSTTEKQKQAAKWFAERFIPDEKAQHFLLLRNGWTPEELGLKKTNLQYRIDRYARYHILFRHTFNTTQVEACHPDAAWAMGLIRFVDNDFNYRTLPTPSPLSFGITASAPAPAPLSTD